VKGTRRHRSVYHAKGEGERRCAIEKKIKKKNLAKKKGKKRREKRRKGGPLTAQEGGVYYRVAVRSSRRKWKKGKTRKKCRALHVG